MKELRSLTTEKEVEKALHQLFTEPETNGHRKELYETLDRALHSVEPAEDGKTVRYIIDGESNSTSVMKGAASVVGAAVIGITGATLLGGVLAFPAIVAFVFLA